MRAGHKWHLIATVMLGAASAPAAACTYAVPSADELARTIVAHGAVFEGTVIQAFGGRLEQPEIIRVDRMIVGDARLRTFVIYHPAPDYNVTDAMRQVFSSCESSNPGYPVGHRGLFVLISVRLSDPLGNGRYARYMFASSILGDERARLALQEIAARSKRLHAPIPEPE